MTLGSSSYPDTAETMTRLAGMLSRILRDLNGDDWQRGDEESPARFAQRYLVSIGAGIATPDSPLSAYSFGLIEYKYWKPGKGNREETLAHAISQLFVNMKTLALQRELEGEFATWVEAIKQMEAGLKRSRKLLENQDYQQEFPARLLFCTESGPIIDSLKVRFPESEVPREGLLAQTKLQAVRAISEEIETDLTNAFGPAEISRLVHDGQNQDGRKPEDRVRKRIDSRAESKKTEFPQTIRNWIVSLDD